MKSIYITVFKPLIDFILAFSLLILLLPLLIIVSLIIIIESPGNPIFKQIRVGKNLNNFVLFKFRSMRINNDKSFTSKNDPRITKIGKFIRKTSIDELPQLFNILLFQMSFVGPRPCQPFEDNQFSKDDYVKRHSIRPGITGLHQVTFRSTGTIEDKARCDTEYVDRISLLFDIKIFFRTFMIILGKNSN